MEIVYILMIILGFITIILGFVLGIKQKNRVLLVNKEKLDRLKDKRPVDMTYDEVRELSMINMKSSFGFIGAMIAGFLIGGGLAIAGFVLLIIN
jgi:hypothetical protein